MPCTPITQECLAIPGGVLKLAGLGNHNRCLIPIQPGPAGSFIVVDETREGFCWLPSHKPAHLTHNKTPFEWSDANQCGNIHIVTVTQNPDGSLTIDPGDGGTTITLPKACCPTLVRNPDGSYTFTNGDGSTVTIPKACCPTLVQNADGSYTFTNGDGSTLTFTASPPGSTPHPALTLTRIQDFTTPASRASLNVTAQTLNIPPAVFAHRRYDGPSQGNGTIPPNTWVDIPLTNTTPTTGVVRDTTGGVMTPASGGIVIPRTGYYQLHASINLYDFADPTADGSVAVTVNGSIYQRGTASQLGSNFVQPFIIFPFALTAGDVVGLAAYTEDTDGCRHVSADLRVLWICD